MEALRRNRWSTVVVTLKNKCNRADLAHIMIGTYLWHMLLHDASYQKSKSAFD